MVTTLPAADSGIDEADSDLAKEAASAIAAKIMDTISPEVA